MKLPSIAWVLTPNYKPVIVLFVDKMHSEALGQWYVTDHGQPHRADRVYVNQDEATSAAMALLDKEQAAVHRSLLIISKRRAVLKAMRT